jgi:hypothetical protein
MASAVKEAVRATKAGADIIIAQGGEGGGHVGWMGSMPLIPMVVDAVGPVPVLVVLSQKNFTSIMLENQIFVEIHWPAEGCDESRKNGG